ncbi:hypothetical protein AYY26_21475 [Photobacterium phosphoreum]|uniref:hypothetical protein n=1 Tax=Photobacterium phosphoreum TaxID=659 RepID=UPI0007F946A6|nr:hypothetical protein [Photobacterium phosphoreum]OBU39499.1 hypothetical protein AYY26_21475 [Photobacterium phosphoreum]
MSKTSFDYYAFYRAASPAPSVTLDCFTTRVKGLLGGQSIAKFCINDILYMDTSTYNVLLANITKLRQKETEALERVNRKYANTTMRVTGFIEFLGSQSRCLIRCTEHGDMSEWGKPWQPKLYRMNYENYVCPKCAGRYRYSVPERITELNQMLAQRATGLSVRDLLKAKGKPTYCLMHCQEHGNGEDWGTPWQPSIGDLKKNGCPKCSKCYRYSEQEATTRVQAALVKFHPHLRFCGFVKYNGKNSRCLIHCQYHGDGVSWGTPWRPDMSVTLRGFGCPKCSSCYRYTVEERIKQLNDKLTDKHWSVLSIDSTDQCDMYCHIHGDGNKWGNPWRPIVSDVNQGYGCPKCQGSYCKTAEEAQADASQKLVDAGFYHRVIGFSGEYQGKESLCNINCTKHGDTCKWEVPWHPRLHDIMMNITNCLKCSGQYRPSEGEAIEVINTLIAERHILVVGFERYLAGRCDKSRCIMQCAVHGAGDDYVKPWRPMLGDLKRTSGCPLCGTERRTLQQTLRNPNQFATPRYLYYITFHHSSGNEVFYKIGVRQGKQRYRRYSSKKMKDAGLDAGVEALRVPQSASASILLRVPAWSL